MVSGWGSGGGIVPYDWCRWRQEEIASAVRLTDAVGGALYAIVQNSSCAKPDNRRIIQSMRTAMQVLDRARYDALAGAALVFALLAPSAGFAEDAVPAAMHGLVAQAQADAQTRAGAAPQQQGLNWETGVRKSYLIPAFEIMGFDFLLNQFNRHVSNEPDYRSNFRSIKNNLTGKWVVDTDPFKINQFLHPYQGSMYHGFARSAGLSYWESSAATFAGSLFWEIAGETTKPSKNDQVASGIGGSFLGEPLFRMASLVLERGDSHRFWREVAAATISPSTGFNRLAFGDRFDTVYSSRGAAIYSRVQFGGSLTALTNQGVSQSFIRNEATLDYAMDYGLPGKPGYSYTRPFDYFSFQATASSANIFENVMTRGLLVGKDYEAANGTYRGVWGLYGSYDYLSPQVFRVSTTALSLGTTAQWQLTDAVALQGTGLLGAGYGAAGTIHGVGERDYHYGLTPQGLLALRLIFGERVALEVSARDYYVSRIWSTEDRGWENVARADAGVTLRVHGNHGVAVKYIYSRREASYPDLGDRLQTRGTVSIFYTRVNDKKLGVVQW